MRRTVGILAVALAAACAGEPEPEIGRVGWPCPNDNNCIRPLRCVEGFCAEVAPEPDAGPVPDAGVEPDAGPPPDGGPEPDAGPGPDAGCEIPATLEAIQSQVFGAPGQPSCNQAACHGEGVAGGVRLTGPLVDLHATLLGPTRAPNAPERDLVTPGDLANSRLWTIMTQPDPGGGGGPMPPGALLQGCEIEAVRAWIEAGAPGP